MEGPGIHPRALRLASRGILSFGCPPAGLIYRGPPVCPSTRQIEGKMLPVKVSFGKSDVLATVERGDSGGEFPGDEAGEVIAVAARLNMHGDAFR